MTPEPPGELTDNQKQVLRMVNRGMSSKEIAIALGIRETSVNDRVDGARAKLGGVPRNTAARMFVEGEVNPEPLRADPDAFGVGRGGDPVHPAQAADGSGRVREQRAVFDAMPPMPLIARLDGWMRSALIVLVAILFAVLSVLLKPMLDGIAWLVAGYHRLLG